MPTTQLIVLVFYLFFGTYCQSWEIAPPIKSCPNNQHVVYCPGCGSVPCDERGVHRACPLYCIAEGVCICLPGYYLNATNCCIPESECPPLPVQSSPTTVSDNSAT